MDIDRIFGLFDPEIKLGEESSILDIYQHPAFKIGMFKKWVINIPNIVKFNIIPFAEVGNVKSEDIKEYITFQVFRKAFEFLEEIDFDTHKDIIKNHKDQNFIKALELSLNHFVDTEEYEKCAVIKKFQDLYQKDLPS